MQNVDAIVVVEFQRDPEQVHTKSWKALQGLVLEQRSALPAPVLTEGSVLELELDAASRELRVEYLRWEHQRQTLHVHVVLSANEATSLRALGVRARRPWVRQRAVEEFLERCRRSGWALRGAIDAKPPEAPMASERIEPTL